MSHYHGIPWPVVRASFRLIRKFFFSREPSEQPYLLINEDLEKISRILGQNHFTNSWELSYNYYGEDLNMRRAEYDESSDRPWRQLHIRGFLQGDSIKLLAHSELEPTEYPDGHLHNEDLSVGDGLYKLKKILDKSDINYREVSV